MSRTELQSSKQELMVQALREEGRREREQRSSKELVTRLRQHAALHDDLAAHSDEQAQWRDDLLVAADLLVQSSIGCTMSQTDNRPSNTGFVCADCKNVFLQAPRCTTCGAEKLYDTTVRNLQEDNARYESGRVVLLGEIEELQKKLSARLQQIEELRMAERLNVETVARLQQERDRLEQCHREGWRHAKEVEDEFRKRTRRGFGDPEPPDEPRLTDPQCDAIISALENHDWQGFSRADIRLLDCTIHAHRAAVTKPEAHSKSQQKRIATQRFEDAAFSLGVMRTEAKEPPDCPHCAGFLLDGTVLHGPRCPEVETPPPPDVLVSALQDKVHTDLPGRAATAVRAVETNATPRDDVACICVGTFGPNPDCGCCGGDGCCSGACHRRTAPSEKPSL